ncbi:MAG: alpha-L-rhamnosidase C-terminal domain-containing protein [Kiritimatiellia bacterium]|nr:alpha-L-rhamnosidase C-terminal domain-containing protein [Kiritimatiellia bacterium]
MMVRATMLFSLCASLILAGGWAKGAELLSSKKLVESKYAPAEIVKKGDAHYFVAFPKHAFGTIEVEIASDVADRVVEVHFAEKLSGEHTIDRKPPGTIRYRKASIKLGKGKHRYRVKIPRDGRNSGGRAIHMPDHIGEVIPFRYCEIVNCPSAITKDGIRQTMAHYPFDDDASAFTSSDETLNEVWELCKYSMKATSFCGVYVDGDRERIPYEADAYLNQLSHYCVDDEYGMAHVTQKHFILHPTWPTEWLLHSPLMAWAEYMYTGDIGFSREYYEDLKLRVLLDLAREDGLISTQTGLMTKKMVAALHLGKPPRDLVDWPPASFTRGKKYGERDKYEMVKVNTVVNAFHYRALVVMGKIAALLKKDADTKIFKARAEKVYESFNRVLWDPDRGVYLDGEGSKHAALHANMFPLALGLVPNERKASVVKHVKSRGMACSVYGAQYLLEGLYEAGEEEYALGLMTAKHDRSWWNMIAVGSTVTLEAWDWKYKNNLDWNHAWGGAPANIIPRYLMGIRPLEPGFKKVLIRPQPGALEKASVKMPTIHGPVHVEFENKKGEPFRLKVKVPSGVTPRVEVPSEKKEGAQVEINGKRVG